jgi:hypothetical protein
MNNVRDAVPGKFGAFFIIHPLIGPDRIWRRFGMELEYSVEPGWFQKWRHALQNWRLFAFIGFFCLLFGVFGYTILSEVVSNGIHSHGDYTSVDLKSLGNFSFDGQGGLLTDVPKDFRNLDGKRVQLRGMMYSTASAYEVNSFQFVYNIAKCCFGGPPKVQERVFVHVPNNGTVLMSGDQVDIIGRLHVRIQRNSEGTVTSVYDLDLESLKPV